MCECSVNKERQTESSSINDRGSLVIYGLLKDNEKNDSSDVIGRAGDWWMCRSCCNAAAACVGICFGFAAVSQTQLFAHTKRCSSKMYAAARDITGSFKVMNARKSYSIYMYMYVYNVLLSQKHSVTTGLFWAAFNYPHYHIEHFFTPFMFIQRTQGTSLVKWGNMGNSQATTQL